MADKCQIDLVVTFFFNFSHNPVSRQGPAVCPHHHMAGTGTGSSQSLISPPYNNIPHKYPAKQNLDINWEKMIWQIQSKVFSTSLHHLNVTFLPPLTACQIQCNRYFSDFQFWLFAFFYFENHSGPSWNRETFRVAMPTQWVPILIF